MSVSSSSAFSPAGAEKAGQPQPESYFDSDSNSSAPQPAQRYVPGSKTWSYSPLNGASVPFWRRTWYCSGVSSARHSCSDFSILAMDKEYLTKRVRGICLELPETSERLSHGAPSFFVREKRCFVMVLDDHHGDGIFGLWAAAPPGNQELLVAADPDRFFRPPYVGHRGWLGVRLDRETDWDEIAGIVEDAWATVAPKRLLGPATD